MDLLLTPVPLEMKARAEVKLFGHLNLRNYYVLALSYLIVLGTVSVCGQYAPKYSEVSRFRRETPDDYSDVLRLSFTVKKKPRLRFLRVRLWFDGVEDAGLSEVVMRADVTYELMSKKERHTESVDATLAVRDRTATNEVELLYLQDTGRERHAQVDIEITLAPKVYMSRHVIEVETASERCCQLLICFKTVMLGLLVVTFRSAIQSHLVQILLIATVPIEAVESISEASVVQNYLLVIAFRLMWIQKSIATAELRQSIPQKIFVGVMVAVTEIGLFNQHLPYMIGSVLYAASFLLHIVVALFVIMRTASKRRKEHMLYLPFSLCSHYVTILTHWLSTFRTTYQNDLTPGLMLITSHVLSAISLRLMDIDAQ